MIAALEKQVEELRKDRERLDWLSTKVVRVSEDYSAGGSDEEIGIFVADKDLRQAIDSAAKEEL